MKTVVCLSILLAVGLALPSNGRGRGRINGRHNTGWGNGDESDGDFNGNGNKGNRNGRRNGNGNVVPINCSRIPGVNDGSTFQHQWLKRCCPTGPCNGMLNGVNGLNGKGNEWREGRKLSVVHKAAFTRSTAARPRTTATPTTTTTTMASAVIPAESENIVNNGWVGQCSTGGHKNYFTIVPGTRCAYDLRQHQGPQEGDLLHTTYCGNGQVFDLYRCQCNARDRVNLTTCRSA